MQNTLQSIIDIYHQKLNLLPVDSVAKKTIITSFGKTNVLIFGDATKPALFLVHGLNSSAPFAFDMVSFLLEEYQIFAIDVLGQPSKSDFVRLNKKDDSYGKWLLEIRSSFKIDKITFCGISFGAFPIIKSLLIDDKNVIEVFLISPAGIINGNILKTIFRFLLPMRKFQKTKNEIYLKKCLENLYDEFDEFIINYQKEIFLNFKMDFSVTPNFKTSELSKIKTPVSIIASKNDFFAPALKLKKKCEKTLINLNKFVVLKNSKHIPSQKALDVVFKNLR